MERREFRPRDANITVVVSMLQLWKDFCGFFTILFNLIFTFYRTEIEQLQCTATLSHHCPEPVQMKGYAQLPESLTNCVSNQNRPHSAEYMLSHAKHSHPVMRHTGSITLKLPKSDHHPQYKSTSHHLSSISSTKNSTFQHSSFYEFHSTYKFICVFVLQFYDPN